MAVSKNNPNARKANIEKLFNGKPVEPIKYVGPYGNYIAAQYKGGDFVYANENPDKPLPYRKIS